jgi:hypothetical protein
MFWNSCRRPTARPIDWPCEFTREPVGDNEGLSIHMRSFQPTPIKDQAAGLKRACE